MSKDPSIDLHGYQKDEVYDALDRFLLKVSDQGAKRARIVTGKGKGIVLKEAQKYLKQAGYPFQFEKMANGKSNEGVLVVFVD